MSSKSEKLRSKRSTGNVAAEQGLKKQAHKQKLTQCPALMPRGQLAIKLAIFFKSHYSCHYYLSLRACVLGHGKSRVLIISNQVGPKLE